MFSETSTDELKKALEELTKQGMKKLVLDLRNNPGGLLTQASNIADLFIDGNKMIVYTKGRVKEFDEEYHAETTYPYEKIPLIVLINKGSTSQVKLLQVQFRIGIGDLLSVKLYSVKDLFKDLLTFRMDRQ